jgi:uncharacterized protein (TIRG00374 family)
MIVPFGLLCCQVALSTLKWYFILKSDSVKASYLFLAKSYLIGNFISLFLPTSFGGDIYRIYSIKQYNLNMPKNISSVIFDRLTGFYALATIATFSYLILYRDTPDFRFIYIYIASISIFLVLSSKYIIEKIKKNQNKIILYLIEILETFRKYKKKLNMLVKALIISFIFQLNMIIIVKFYCIALSIDIDIEKLFIIVPIVFLTEMIPISINGLGIREGAFVFFFSVFGRTYEEALSLSLLVITMRYTFSTTFGGTLLISKFVIGKKSKMKIVPVV